MPSCAAVFDLLDKVWQTEYYGCRLLHAKCWQECLAKRDDPRPVVLLFWLISCSHLGAALARSAAKLNTAWCLVAGAAESKTARRCKCVTVSGRFTCKTHLVACSGAAQLVVCSLVGQNRHPQRSVKLETWQHVWGHPPPCQELDRLQWHLSDQLAAAYSQQGPASAVGWPLTLQVSLLSGTLHSKATTCSSRASACR